MLRLRKRYFVIILINTAIVYFIMSANEKPDDLIFSTDYIFDILDTSKRLELELEKAEAERTSTEQYAATLNQDIIEKTSQLTFSQRSLQACNDEQRTLREMSAKQKQERDKNKNQQQCSDETVALEFTKTQLNDSREQINVIAVEKQALVAEAETLRQNIDKLNKKATYFDSQKKAFTELIQVLRQDLSLPIYIKQLYVTPRYCQSQNEATTVCLDNVLLLPKFSKTPLSEVAVKIRAPNKRVIAELTYNASSDQVLSQPFTRNNEFPSGDFQFSFTVDGQTLVETYRLDQAAN
jgi:myosin heavy subunit